MDKVLKRRLVGATILIALAVIFIPMLLDDPDSGYGERRLAVDLPASPDAGREIRRLPLDPDTARRPVTPLTDIEEAPRRLEPDTDPVPDAVDDPPETPVAETEIPPPVPAPVEEPEDRDAAEGNWIVQVASFGSAATAETIAARLDQLGHQALLDTVVRGEATLHRIRTGPYSSRNAAEAARAQISRTVAGVEPRVISLDEDRLAADDRIGSGYAVQVGSFASRDNAVRLTEQLSAQGFKAFLHEELSGGRPIWRVRVGPEAERVMAEQMLAQLRQEARLEGMVVSHP